MQELLNNPPDFVRSDEQLSYYGQIISLLTENGVALKTQDKFAIGTLAINLDLIDECVNDIIENGRMIECHSDRGAPIKKVNPSIALQKDAQTAVRFYFKEFQMSPSSRGNSLNVPKGGNDDSDGFNDL